MVLSCVLDAAISNRVVVHQGFNCKLHFMLVGLKKLLGFSVEWTEKVGVLIANHNAIMI